MKKEVESTCPEPLSRPITTNSPVTEGRTLTLESLSTEQELIRWYGPNGYVKEYQYFDNQAHQQARENVTMADAGEYKIQYIDGNGCVYAEGTTTVEVIAAPLPSCNVAANTAFSSVSGVGEYNFTYKSFQQSSSFFEVEGSEGYAGGDAMHWSFISVGVPSPGIYKTAGYAATTNLEVGVSINTGTYQFVANSGQDVYVNKVNGKTEITFCNLSFNNPLAPSVPIYISANITE